MEEEDIFLMDPDSVVLTSGTAYFDESFQALPRVLDALTARDSTRDVLASDAVLVEKKLAALLESSSQVLLDAVSNVSSVASDFDGSRARVRDLRRRLQATIASFSGKRRELNSLHFRKTQLDVQLALLEQVEVCLLAAEADPSEEVDELRKALTLLDGSLRSSLPQNLSSKLESRLLDKKNQRAKLVQSKLENYLAGFSDQYDSLKADLFSLKELNELTPVLETVAQRYQFTRPPSRSQGPSGQVGTNLVLFSNLHFLSVPKLRALEHGAEYVGRLVAWSKRLLHAGQAVEATCAKLASAKSSEHRFYQSAKEHVEQTLVAELGLLFRLETQDDMPATSSLSLYTGLDKFLLDEGKKEEEAIMVESHMQSSPYMLLVTHQILSSFAQEESLAQVSTLLHNEGEKSLQTEIKQDIKSAALKELGPQAKPSEVLKHANRLRAVVSEIRLVLGDLHLAKVAQDVLEDITTPFLHASKQLIDAAVDSTVVAFMDQNEGFLSNLRKSPLFQAIESRRKGDEPPARELLLDASFSFLRAHPLDRTQIAHRTSASDLSTLLASHTAIHRVALACEVNRTELLSLADYALFAACVDLLLQQETNKQHPYQLRSALRDTRQRIEFYVESPAIYDFLFLPVCFWTCEHLMDTKRFSDGEILRLTFASTLVDATKDPNADLAPLFVPLHLLARCHAKSLSKQSVHEKLCGLSSPLLSPDHLDQALE